MFTPKERCWPIGVPGFLLYPVTPVYFLQTPEKVVMIWEEDHMARRIYLTDRHSPNVKPSWFGESIGHYENGDTLVVDTIGLNTRTFVDSYRTPHTQRLHVVERFRIVDSGKALEVNVRVEDPGAFTMPWNAMQRYRRVSKAQCARRSVPRTTQTSSNTRLSRSLNPLRPISSPARVPLILVTPGSSTWCSMPAIALRRLLVGFWRHPRNRMNGPLWPRLRVLWFVGPARTPTTAE
jgi:hypothetical protein